MDERFPGIVGPSRRLPNRPRGGRGLENSHSMSGGANMEVIVGARFIVIYKNVRLIIGDRAIDVSTINVSGSKPMTVG